jgi:signal transduction histidine kinase
MSQVRNEQHFVREILRIMAVTDEPRDCYLPILEAAREITGASGAFVMLFEDPRLLITCGGLQEGMIPPVERMRPIVSKIGVDDHFAPLPINEDTVLASQPSLAYPLMLQQEAVGLLYLGFSVEPMAPLPEMIDILLDSVLIVTKTVRTNARHQKLARNQSEFMRIVSHDLRSPLTSMKGFGSMLESGMVGDMNEKQEHFIDKIMAGVQQMTALVENIQDAGRYDPETGFYEMQRAPSDLTDIVNRIVSNHLVPAEKQELTVSKSIADDIPIINIDSTIIERAITNLVDNAIKYTPNGRNVEVSLYRQDNHVVVSVQDSGFGISPENQKMLFERHVRIPRKEHKRVKGSGLGLFIVRSVARRHGGDAWIESVEGEGSTFFVSIPLSGENLIGN